MSVTECDNANDENDDEKLAEALDFLADWIHRRTSRLRNVQMLAELIAQAADVKQMNE